MLRVKQEGGADDLAGIDVMPFGHLSPDIGDKGLIERDVKAMMRRHQRALGPSFAGVTRNLKDFPEDVATARHSKKICYRMMA